ncbi:Sodium-dependent phosphate transport protein [Dorcoceras hygrometricum]|uniref:Sodium-dependent phosphate transport protein n=1 Tax=Dorcoceras hygrometricum TaxID=472368 RepID=A0A2Z7AAW6_9LAMI|nr:Sodium-dependent phosphate transport protein [Dorcoceras hygrometricum]
MASSFYSNTQHIDFSSVLAMNDPGMVSMFQALIASGLEGFLGCTTVVYETALIDFFENASVRDGVQCSEEEPVVQKTNDDLLDDDEHKLLEDILLTIPVDIPLPSASMEITKIVMGKEIKIPEKLATINIEKMYKKEEKVLSWGETESPQLAIQRNLYILLKYREVLVRKYLESCKSNFVPGQGSSAVDLKVIDLLSDLHLFILEELTKEARAHGLSWKKPCFSGVIEGEIHDRGAVIARSNTSTRSSCWIRTMLNVDGAWIVEPCADQWVKLPRQIISCEVHRQCQYDGTLPSVSDFFKLLNKRWTDVCLEVVAFCSSRRLLPVGSVTFCRGLPVGETVFRVAPRHSPVFAFRVSHFCSVFIDFSLFSWLPTADITDFLSSMALNRTAFRNAQISQNTVSVAPSVQLSLDQRQSSPTSTDSSSSLYFDTTDLDATASSLPSVSIDFSAALAEFQVILSEQINESQSGISSRLHKIEHGLRDSLREQAEVFKILFQEARQEGRTIDDVQTLRFNEFRKNILAQNASIFTGLADVRKEVQEVHAKVDIMASRLNDVRLNVEETKEALSHQLLEFQSQAQANHNILHAQLSELVNYINRGSADKKGESRSRGPQQPPNVQLRDSGTGGDSAVRTPTFAQRVEMVQRQIVENVLDADRNSESLERQAGAERDRERRRREARLLKKIRRF